VNDTGDAASGDSPRVICQPSLLDAIVPLAVLTGSIAASLLLFGLDAPAALILYVIFVVGLIAGYGRRRWAPALRSLGRRAVLRGRLGHGA
jgi:hypothetical protein